MPHTRQTFDTVPFRPERNATIDTFRWAGKRHAVVSLLQVDVTATRRAIDTYRARTGRKLSFTAWVVRCVARAAAEHPGVHAIRKGRRHMVRFRQVDVALLVERQIRHGQGDETLPMPVVIRNANDKTLLQIHEEVRQAQATGIAAGTASLDTGPPHWLQALFFRLPAWLRDLVFWRWLMRSPTRIKKTMGTVAVTATGMMAPGVLAWGIPHSIHPLAIGVGGIAQVATANGLADMLALTVVFDHAVTDGAPVARFVRRLHELMTLADGLPPADADGSQ